MPARFPHLVYWIIFFVILGLMVLPLGLAIAAESIAEANGCHVHEGFPNPCLIDGSDWGETLYAWFVMGWLTFVSVPLGVIGLVIWGIVYAVHRGSWERRHQTVVVFQASAGPQHPR